jgi:hypothetical protein
METVSRPDFSTKAASGTYPVDEEPEVLGRQALQTRHRDDVVEAELDVLQGFLLARDHPANRRTL